MGSKNWSYQSLADNSSNGGGVGLQGLQDGCLGRVRLYNGEWEMAAPPYRPSIGWWHVRRRPVTGCTHPEHLITLSPLTPKLPLVSSVCFSWVALETT